MIRALVPLSSVTSGIVVAVVHPNFGLFMNWTGTQKGEGFEYHLLAIAIAGLLMIRGAGAASVDRFLAVRQRR